MSAGTQPLPASNVTELAANAAFAATGLPDVPVFMGPCSKGPINTPTLFGAGDTAGLVATFGTGPTVKETALAVVDVAQPFVFMRMTTATVATLVNTPTVVRGGSSNFLSTLSGTALDGAEVTILFGTVGGNTGTGPIAYQVSVGGDYGSVQALGTATSVVVLGVTVTLGSGKIVTAGDTISWVQYPPSSTVLPLTFTGTGTSVITVTGTGVDAYEVGVRFTAAGTIAASPPTIKFQYALDYLSASPTWSPEQSLGTANTSLLLDGPISQESTGLTLNFAAGTIVLGDLLTFRTSAPTYDASGLVAATTALASVFNNGTVIWTWVRAIGPVPEAVAADADAIAIAWEASTQPAWIIVDALDRAGTTQTWLGWSAYLRASYSPYTSTRVPVAAGMLRGFDPINGRLNRRSNLAFALARAMGAGGTTLATDWGEFARGALNASVTMTDASGVANEHNANQDPSLQAMGFVTARTWPGEVGIFPTKASLLGPVNDIQRIPLRRVMDLAKKLEKRALRLFTVKTFRQWTSQPGPLQAKSPYVAGDIYEPDVRKINGIVNDLLTRVVLNKGYVSGIQFFLDPTPTSNGGGSYSITGAMQLESLLYVDVANGTAQFVGAVT